MIVHYELCPTGVSNFNMGIMCDNLTINDSKTMEVSFIASMEKLELDSIKNFRAKNEINNSCFQLVAFVGAFLMVSD